MIPAESRYRDVESKGYCRYNFCLTNSWRAIGNAFIDVNLYGLKGFGSQCEGESIIKLQRDGSLYIRSRWMFREPMERRAIAYHEVVYGAKPWGFPAIAHPHLALPIQIRYMPRILIDFSYRFTSLEPGGSLLLSSWLFEDQDNTRAPSERDLLVSFITFVKSGLQVNGKLLGIVSIPMMINGELVYRDLEVWLHKHLYTIVTFVLREGVEKGTIAFDYTHLVQNIKEILEKTDRKMGDMLARDIDKLNLMSIELGAEVFTAGEPVNLELYIYRYRIASTDPGLPTSKALELWLEKAEEKAITIRHQ